jgi:hypothetical protein
MLFLAIGIEDAFRGLVEGGLYLVFVGTFIVFDCWWNDTIRISPP